jgi:hypothetical protein
LKNSEILDMPRERHYTLGHEAFRQLCEYDPHQFFERMASDACLPFVSELIRQVEANCPNDPTVLEAESIKVTPTVIGKRPLLIIQMPPVAAYAECILVGIVLEIDINQPNVAEKPDIHYFTFELGEGDDDDCKMFCQWQGDTHYNLGELNKNAGWQEFALVIQQRLGDDLH